MESTPDLSCLHILVHLVAVRDALYLRFLLAGASADSIKFFEDHQQLFIPNKIWLLFSFAHSSENKFNVVIWAVTGQGVENIK